MHRACTNANPVILYNHQRFGSDLPIATATASVVNGRLECEITFVSAKANPLAEQVWQSVLEKSLRAVSVGFRPHAVQSETINDQDVAVLDDNELYEISVTPIGANPEALAKTKALASERAAAQGDGGAELGDLVDSDTAKDLEELGFGGTLAAPEPVAKVDRAASGAELAAMLDAQPSETREGDLAEMMNGVER